MTKRPLSPQLRRAALRRRDHGLKMHEFLDVFFGVEELTEYLTDRIELQRKELEDKEKAAKEKGKLEGKDNFFNKKFTFGGVVLFSFILQFFWATLFGVLFLKFG